VPCVSPSRRIAATFLPGLFPGVPLAAHDTPGESPGTPDGSEGMPFAVLGVEHAVKCPPIAVEDGWKAAIAGLITAITRTFVARSGDYAATCVSIVTPGVPVAVKNGSGEKPGVAVAANSLPDAAIYGADAANDVSGTASGMADAVNGVADAAKSASGAASGVRIAATSAFNAATSAPYVRAMTDDRRPIGSSGLKGRASDRRPEAG